MEEIVANIVKELPSTGLLILFVWFVGKQFDLAMKLLTDHLNQLNGLIANCMESKKEAEESLERKLEERFEERFVRFEDKISRLSARSGRR